MTCVEVGHQESTSLSPHCARTGQECYPLLQLPLTTTLAPVLAQSMGSLALPLRLTCPQTG